jgi:cobaltochelatase CobN
MHIQTTTSATLDDLVEPIDLRQTPGDVVVLSLTDSDLAGLAMAYRLEADHLPSLRLASIRDLRHPMSVDLWIDRMGRRAKVILVRLLGGYDYWSYGCEQLAAMAHETGAALVLLPGECREQDLRLAALTNQPAALQEDLLAYFREGGLDNMRALLRRLAGLPGYTLEAGKAAPLPRAGFYDPDTGIVGRPRDPGECPVVPILFYRSMLLAGDVAPIDALAAALHVRAIAAVPIFVASLKDAPSLRFVEDSLAQLRPSAIVTTTAFSTGADADSETFFDRLGVPVLQAIIATTRREAWAGSPRGLGPADLAMHVVLPELDGRVLAGAISFKDRSEASEALSFTGQMNRPVSDRVDGVAARVAALLHLQATPISQRRVAVLMPDYPAAAGRTGYAVGLDVPASVLAILTDLAQAGYGVETIPESARALLADLATATGVLPVTDYEAHLATLPEPVRAALTAAWGNAVDDPDVENGAFRFRKLSCGNIVVALAPDRGRRAERRADYHSPELPPRHALVAFGFWLRRSLGLHVLVHVGAHGTLEWLPGKTVALSSTCYPELVTGSLPVVYPFIVSNPGEAAQAKRRIAAVTIGHLPPPLVGAGLTPEQQELERLVDEYAQADGLDRRRRDRLARLIVRRAAASGLATDAGVGRDTDSDEALKRIDSWLCDLKDFAIKDGLHIYGRADPAEVDDLRLASASAERTALLDALDGRHVRPGPSGAPARGRLDVLPTGRNLFTADPRTLPTATAFDLGRAAADEVLRLYRLDHGDWPRVLVLDLWGSANLRSGGEQIGQGLALMGCRPQWEPATGRVTGIEVLAPAAMGRPRVDVTFRISGLFRDLFPTQIALLDAATRAVALRDEEEEENPLAADRRETDRTPLRIFGSAPGTYGAGIEDLLASGAWNERDELGRAYLKANSHVFGGSDADGEFRPGGLASRIAAADILVHAGDDPARDILDGSADVAFMGGFAAAATSLGRAVDLIHLDTTDPYRPRARSLAETLTRVVRARALNPKFIDGQLRHGPRGAAELLETVDRLIGFVETTDVVPHHLIDAVYDAYLGDPTIVAFMKRENPTALRAMATRFSIARSRSLWQPLRNSVDAHLAELTGEAVA